MSNDDDIKRDLECLRLASDLTQLSHQALDPDLRAHCTRMAAFWSGQADGGFEQDVAWNDEPDKPATAPLARPPTVVLLVEDEPLLRELTAAMIDEAGFTALEANTADDALAVLEARSDIALLFTDIDMPGSMDGLKLAQVAHDRWPTIRTLVASGKVRPVASELPPNSAFLAKPYRGTTLIVQLRSMIAPV